MAGISLLFLIMPCIFGSLYLSHAETDTLKQGQQLHDWEQLISAEGVFRLGFFSLDSNSVVFGSFAPRYIGIWFDRIPIYPVWVANPKNPIPDSSGVLTVDSDDMLKIAYRGQPPMAISSNNQATKIFSNSNVTATLLDSGNLVLREVGVDGITGPVLWQSFDYPSNMLLPEMKLGMNLKTGHEWYLSSWLSDKVPSPGAFKLGLDPDGSEQLIIWRRGEVYWKSGVWRNGSFQLAPMLTTRVDEYEFRFDTNENESYFSYSVKNRSATVSRWELETLGQITQFTLERRNNSDTWIFETTGKCETDLHNQTAVCLSEKPSKCRNGSELFEPKKGYMNSPGYNDNNASLALSDCHAKCWQNCFCVAYKSSSYNGTGCVFWTRESEFIPDQAYEEFYLLTLQHSVVQELPMDRPTMSNGFKDSKDSNQIPKIDSTRIDGLA
ncbi:hypothetical protein JRO89_XS04G0147600 [Xanthoceras sorbifolium]|uniref:Bulb-type lectin domain-containing protein n=1 Tax=Xanthoceras sorbifolium TaxID=99658 RepID=A0ABQ8I5I5_9ROSI|nr:hypothetical protein JRO89_XS04G0147600 [Xanthoceras sorbifolium]